MKMYREIKGRLRSPHNDDEMAEVVMWMNVGTWDSCAPIAQYILELEATTRIAAVEGAGWISVKDRFPPDANPVVVYGVGHQVASFDGEGWYLGDGYYDLTDDADKGELPTHWMPLPEPPKDSP